MNNIIIENKEALLNCIENLENEQYRYATKFFDDYEGAAKMRSAVKKIVKQIEAGKANVTNFETLNHYSLLPSMTLARFVELVKGE